MRQEWLSCVQIFDRRIFRRVLAWWTGAPLRVYLVLVVVFATLPVSLLMAYQIYGDLTAHEPVVVSSIAALACLFAGIASALWVASWVERRDTITRARLHAKASEFEQARKEAEAASRAKDEFLTMLSHELRNPLGAISASIEVLERVPGDSVVASEARGIIGRQTANLAHMMNDLLDVSRVMTDKIVLVRKPLDLTALVERVGRTIELTGVTAGLDLQLELGPAWINGDAIRIEQVVNNLVSNAAKYTPAGGRVTLMTTCDPVSGLATLIVKDTGVGIPEALLPRVFDLFVQGDRPLDRRAGGLGIGLTLVRQIVELHGGHVTAMSDACGSTFTVQIPAIEAPLSDAGSSARIPGKRRSILLIEDNHDVLSALRARLEVEGHRVQCESNGSIGLATLLSSLPDVAIIDIGLPGLTGFELARMARRSGYAGRMVALTGYGRPADIQKARVAGFDAHLVKPAERDLLLAAVNDSSFASL